MPWRRWGQDRSVEYVGEFLDDALRRWEWWAGAAQPPQGDDGADWGWRLGPTAPAELGPLLAGCGPSPLDGAALEPFEPHVLPVDAVPCLAPVAGELARMGVRKAVQLEIAGVPERQVRLLLLPSGGSAVSDDALAALRASTRLLLTVLRQELEFGELSWGALRDPLTGLLNRRGLEQSVMQRPADAPPAAVVFFDLDRFKAVNDVHGHASGDEVLVAVASRLVAEVRPSDTLARVGGDEFVLIAEGIARAEDALPAVQRISSSVTRDLVLSRGKVVRVSISAGIAEWRASSSFADALSSADALMYEAKRIGGGIALEGLSGGVIVAEPTVGSTAREHVEAGRSPALASRIASARSGEEWGGHLLLRGELSRVPPGQLVEDVRRALRVAGLDGVPHLVVEPRGHGWAADGVLLEAVKAILAELGPPGVTLMTDGQPATRELRHAVEEVRDLLGCGLALAAIGAGVSELSRLSLSRPDLLVVDDRFLSPAVSASEARLVVGLAGALARHLSAPLLALGVRDGHLASDLAAWGCDLVVVGSAAPDSTVPSVR